MRLATNLLIIWLAVSMSLFCGSAGTWAQEQDESRFHQRFSLQDMQGLADMGNDEAQFGLGVMYENGDGVPQDYRQAAVWYRKSAEQGLPLCAPLFSPGLTLQKNL